MIHKRFAPSSMYGTNLTRFNTIVSHLISRDSLVSERGERLMVGLMRLVLRLSDLGVDLASGVRLCDPLAALKQVCLDVSCQEQLNIYGRKSMTAVDIQRHYIEHIENHMQELPDWAPDIIAEAKQTLDQLERNPMELVGQLDWPTKRFLFQSGLPQQSWEQLEADNALIARLKKLCDVRRLTEVRHFNSAIAHRAIRAPYHSFRDKLLEEKGGLSWLDSFAKLRSKMFYLDMLFSDVNNCLWDQVADTSICQVTKDDVHAATTNAPSTTRAKVRGELIRKHHSQPHYCVDWAYIFGPKIKIDVRDPFAIEGVEKPDEPRRTRRPRQPRIDPDDIPDFLRRRTS